MNKILPDWVNEFEEGMDDAKYKFPRKYNKSEEYYSGYEYIILLEEDNNERDLFNVSKRD